MSKYGTLENGQPKNAPYVVEYAGRTRVTDSLAKQEANSIGYKEFHLSAPTEPAGEGKHWEQDGYDETATDISRRWKVVDDPVLPKRYSVPDLFFWLRIYDSQHADAPKGQATVDWLDAANLYTIAVTTRVVSEDNELFSPTLAALKGSVGFTDEEIAAALAYAETDAMPDTGV